tara:strand:- start:8950 stop:9840 length:891 start_codon:yes stop_codon:yes gene_type:complete
MKRGLIIKLRPLEGLEVGTKGLVASGVVGSYKSVFKGRGLEFAGYRQYMPGDDASLIDWKASARMREILIKEFEEERNLNVFFLVDASNSMVYSSISKLKCEYAAELVGSLGFVILHSGDSVGFTLFSDKILSRSLPFGGQGRHFHLMKELSNVNNYGGHYDLVHALKYVGSFLERGSVLIVVSDFIGLKGDWENHLRLASQKYDVIGVMVRDPRDKKLPKMGMGNVLLEDPYSGEQIVVDTEAVAPQYKRHVAQQERKLKEIFLQSNADFLSLSTDEDFVGPLFRFFKERRSRLR